MDLGKAHFYGVFTEITDANGRFGSVSVLKPRFSAETELTAKPTDKTELQNRSQNYCKIE
ncbi:hypothetical protein RhiirA4_469696 [Rhizophagus irregularis]|uniref:Uncharacterized protein n=1 Tax=Rhizophagus irregularis TaxID=588596 RepID=A0A2I1H000_9GLOM|nr:hypothetical protein RhiirA4_469696 [Rhizophagus irregularis]